MRVSQFLVDMKKHMPIPGQRIIRSVCAVALCFVTFFLRGQKGIPFYSALAVLQCMQPYHDSSVEVAKKRTIGTFVGAFWGLVMILLELYVLGTEHLGSFLSYMLIAIFTGIVLYSTVVLECKNTAYFSCVVFLSITVMHITDASPVLFVINRVVDTLIGVLLALVVNSFHLPRTKNTNVLFVSGMDDTLLTSKEKLTPYSKVELNRIIEQGAKFTVSTIRTPAFIRESLEGVRLKLPVIAMDGAVLYDMNENSFLMSYQMSYTQALRVMKVLDEEEVCYFTNVVIDDMLVIYYNTLKNEAEREIYEHMRKSPYRNYVNRRLPEQENVVYFMLIQERKKAEKLYDRLQKIQDVGEYKMLLYDSTDYPGYSYIKIYHKDATREHMLQNLLAFLNMEKTMTFGSVHGKCDVYVEDSDRNTMVKKLKKYFEPIKIGSLGCGPSDHFTGVL